MGRVTPGNGTPSTSGSRAPPIDRSAGEIPGDALSEKSEKRPAENGVCDGSLQLSQETNHASSHMDLYVSDYDDRNTGTGVTTVGELRRGCSLG